MMERGDQFIHDLLGFSIAVVTLFARQRQAYLLEKKQGRKLRLAPLEEIFLLFIFFRHFPVDILLGSIFDLKERTAGNSRKRILPWFYDTVKHRITHNNIAERMRHSTQLFHHIYTFAIDGSEQPIHSSKNPFANSRYYSTKKGWHSVNIVVICDLTGKIIWISPAFPGSYNDAEVCKKTAPSLQWIFKEWGFGDKGFVGVEYRCLREEIRIPFKSEEELLETVYQCWVSVSVLQNDYR